jgi:peptidoglycan/xylan/chitin deacetylase (PgdA/CDA1 family)
MLQVCVTVDVEPDCPPYLGGWRGLEEGMPRLLALFAELEVCATFFTTGESAERYPETVRAVVAGGHELGCHGHTHRAFPALGREEAREELERSSAVLRAFAAVVSFRAPYLRFPVAYLPLLEALDFRLDSSQGRYKSDYLKARARSTEPSTPLLRVPASVTSSALRLPARVRNAYLRAQRSPLVLFVHPWEFVDLTRAPIPWHCRIGTGDYALAALGGTIRMLEARGARFSRMNHLLGDPAGA